MQFIKTLLSFFIIIFFFSSCTNNAIDFNNGLVNIQKSVLKEVQDFGKKMKEVNVDSLPATDVKKDADKITSFISNKINEAQNLSVPKGGESLKAAIVMQLEFEKDIVDKIGKLTVPEISQDEKAQIQAEFLNSQNKATELEANVRAAQEAFARQYKFKLETK